MKSTNYKNLTIDDINFETRRQIWWEKDLLKLAKNISTDPDKKDRLGRNLCKKCYYTPSLAGQAFTEYRCGLCKSTQLHHNTDTPALCLQCAALYKLCVHCSCTINLKELNKM